MKIKIERYGTGPWWAVYVKYGLWPFWRSVPSNDMYDKNDNFFPARYAPEKNWAIFGTKGESYDFAKKLTLETLKKHKMLLNEKYKDDLKHWKTIGKTRAKEKRKREDIEDKLKKEAEKPYKIIIK